MQDWHARRLELYDRLHPRRAELLAALERPPGHLHTAAELLIAVWGLPRPHTAHDRAMARTALYRLRPQIADVYDLVTLPRRGYRLNPRRSS